MFSIIYEPVHGIIYKNSKKEKRVMRHSEIHKFCDATLNRVLEGLKSYNNDVKYGYVQRELTNDEVEYLKLFEEEIEMLYVHVKMYSDACKDALALTPCYSAFLITANVPEVYMHQFWDSVYKHDTFYKFKMDKRKRFKLNLEIFRDIFKICPRVHGQDFDALPTDEEIVDPNRIDLA
ncbi:hypothetical protein Tco_1319045 [Tanacetum coccineum]